MMYIFEGVDQSGKDTIINLLQQTRERLGFKKLPVFNGLNVYDKSEFPIVHEFIKDKEEWQKAISFEIVNFVQQTKADVIINRFTWSEIVYSRVIRGKEPSKFYTEYMMKLLASNAKIIYVFTSVEEIQRRIRSSNRYKSQEIKENIQNLSYEYARLCKDLYQTIIPITSNWDLLEDENKQNRLALEIFDDLKEKFI